MQGCSPLQKTIQVEKQNRQGDMGGGGKNEGVICVLFNYGPETPAESLEKSCGITLSPVNTLTMVHGGESVKRTCGETDKVSESLCDPWETTPVRVMGGLAGRRSRREFS